MSSISQKFLTGSIIMLVIRFAQRLIGLVSTLILARLLTPDDFATVAIVAITLQIFEILSDSGDKDYITQKTTIDVEDINSCWTLNLLLKSSLFILLFICAPLLASFFENQDLKAALQATSFVLVINAFVNPGLNLYLRNLEYHRIFWLSVLQKFISFLVAIGVAFYNPSFWAIVCGDLTAATVLLLGSYIIHTHKPRLTLSKFSEQWQFSKWIFLKGILGVLRSQIDTLLISKLYPKTTVGHYHMAKSVALIPTELMNPILEPMVAVLAKSKQDIETFCYRFRLCFLGTIALTTPFVFYIALFPLEIISVLLGDQWLEGEMLLRYLAIFLLTIPINMIAYQAFIALGRVKELFIYDLLSLLFIAISLLSLPVISVETFALIRSLLAITTTGTFYIYFANQIAIKLDRLAIFILPFLSAAVLSGVITLSLSAYIPDIAIVKLLITGVCFCLLYGLFTIAIFVLCFQKNTEMVFFVNILKNNAKTYLEKIKHRLPVSGK